MERHTRQRSAIRGAIEQAGRPLSVQELLVAARAGQSRLGIATVYRAVKALVDERVLRTVQIAGAVARYELAHLGHHHHFHCRGCDRVYEIESCPGSLQGMAPRGFRMEGHDLTITGLCATCVGEGAPRRRPRAAARRGSARGHVHQGGRHRH